MAHALVDEADWELVDGLRWHLSEGYPASSQVGISKKGHTLFLHRLLMSFPARGKTVDHINGDKLDNRRENLRVVDYSVNGFNRRGPNSNGTSGIRGVNPFRGKWWVAQIKVNYQRIYLGIFLKKEDAIAARRKAEKQYGVTT